MKYVDENKDKEQSENDDFECRKQELFEIAVNEMKQTTRRYAKTQIKWVRNRFIKSKLTKKYYFMFKNL